MTTKEKTLFEIKSRPRFVTVRITLEADVPQCDYNRDNLNQAALYFGKLMEQPSEAVPLPRGVRLTLVSTDELEPIS